MRLGLQDRLAECVKYNNNGSAINHDNIAVLAFEVGARYLQETQQHSTSVGRNIN